MKKVNFKENHSAGESGFILIWTLFIVLPLTFVGLVFVMYGEMNVRKLEAQYHAMNLVVAGTRNSEYDSGETLNSMAALADADGFTDTAPTQAWQSTPFGDLAFVHNTDSGEKTVTSYIVLEQGVVHSLLSSFTGVDVVGTSRAKPGRLLITLVLDYSKSLHNDFTTSDLQEALEIRTAAGAQGPNGVTDGYNQIAPDDVALLAFPYTINENFRIRRPWKRQNASRGWTISVNPTCVPTEENGCSGTEPSTLGAANWSISNQFFAYKKAAAVLLGVVAQASPHLDVEFLGGVMPDWVTNFVNAIMYGDPAQPNHNPVYTEFINDGSFEVWRYDDPTVTGYSAPWPPTNPPVVPLVSESHGVENPKDVFADDALMDIRFPTINYMTLTGYRKLFKYATMTGATSGKTILPGQYSSYFDPPLPVLTRPEFNPPPPDAFTYNPGPLTGTDLHLQNELSIRYGYPTYPSPWFSVNGPGHPPGNELHTPIGDGYIYSCDPNDPVGGNSGPPITNSAQLTTDKESIGYWLCLIRDYCDDFIKNDSPGCNTGILATEIDVYNTGTDSPNCAAAGYIPRCNDGSGNKVTDCAVNCVFGDSVGNMIPRTIGELGNPDCYDPVNKTFNGATPICDPGGIPAGHGNCDTGVPCKSAASGGNPGVPPVSLGTISLPANPPNVGNSLFYYVNDMGLLNTGTMTHNSVPNARCQEFKDRTEGLGECAYLLVTDGRPLGITEGGVVLIDDTTINQEMSDRMDLFTETLGGKSFTWFLGRFDTWQRIVNQVQAKEDNGQLNASQSLAFADVKNSIQVCSDPVKGPAWTSIPGTMDCPQIDDTIDEHTTSSIAMGAFQTTMNDPTKSRFWTTTSLENSPTGPSITGSLGTFLGGLKRVIALLKREPQFDK